MKKFFPKEVLDQAISRMSDTYERLESRAIANILLEKIYGLSNADIIINQLFEVTPEQKNQYDHSIVRLLNHEPIQYILNEAHFYRRKFYVDQNVLIPRQETESLIELIKGFETWETPKIGDIGTGTGCIAITLALEIAGAAVHALDVSQKALAVAKKNAATLSAKVRLVQNDMLKDSIPGSGFDIIVSNPPYVLASEKKEIKQNVLIHEPALALFVPDNDPLVFYRAIMQQGVRVLKNGGLMFFEINERFGNEMSGLFESLGYSSAKIHKDLNGKDRFASAILL